MKEVGRHVDHMEVPLHTLPNEGGELSYQDELFVLVTTWVFRRVPWQAGARVLHIGPVLGNAPTVFRDRAPYAL